MLDVKNIIEDSHAREPQDKMIEEEIGNWTIVSHDSGARAWLSFFSA